MTRKFVEGENRVMSPIKCLLVAGLYAAAALAAFPAAAEEFAYEGHRKCSSCHRSQSESWRGTAHAKAFDSLAPNHKAEAKRKAGLDPPRITGRTPNAWAATPPATKRTAATTPRSRTIIWWESPANPATAPARNIA